MSICVVDRRRWHRTKIICAIGVFLVAFVCAGGLESRDGMEPMPSFSGFAASIGLLTWLMINIARDGEW